MKRAVLISLLYTILLSPNDVLAQVPCTVQFRINNAGIDVHGTIEGNMKIKFDPDNLSASVVETVLLPATIQTGIAIRDKHLCRADYFDTDRYPEIRVRSESFSKKGAGKFSGKFKVTIKGVDKTMTLPFTTERIDKEIVYRCQFEINRLDFAIGEKSAILDEKVMLNVEARTPLQTLR